MKRSIVLAFLLVGVLSAEQSVYSDADFIDSDAIAKKNSREIFRLKQKINALNEKIEGLKSIIDGQANEIAQLKQNVNTTNLEKIINELSQRVAALESKPPKVVEKVVVKNSSAIGGVKEIVEPKKEEPKKISSKELFKKAVLNFNKNRLTKAQEQFKELLKRGYKSASVNFYLGEIAYKRGKNTDAISYYQKSATLNENASYMDRLLLHTAITLHRSGKKQQAKNFFEAIVSSYPDSASAKEAKKYLK